MTISSVEKKFDMEEALEVFEEVKKALDLYDETQKIIDETRRQWN
jgi:hypothetical protein